MRVAGHEALVFVDDIQNMAQVIADHAQAGDVVMCMGAGSIGQVPAQVLALVAQRNNTVKS
jgi:UDP-N-acetylmuramate--alanine ligase